MSTLDNSMYHRWLRAVTLHSPVADVDTYIAALFGYYFPPSLCVNFDKAKEALRSYNWR